MLPFLLAATLLADGPAPTDSMQVDMFCAYVVGIEYGTDDVTDDQFRRFTVCRNSVGVPEKSKGGLV